MTPQAQVRWQQTHVCPLQLLTRSLGFQSSIKLCTACSLSPCAVKLVTGSLQGVLRVHQPHQQGYHIEDILLETQLDSSILQLAAGNFLG